MGLWVYFAVCLQKYWRNIANMMILMQTDMHRNLCQKNEAGDLAVGLYGKQIHLSNCGWICKVWVVIKVGWLGPQSRAPPNDLGFQQSRAQMSVFFHCFLIDTSCCVPSWASRGSHVISCLWKALPSLGCMNETTVDVLNCVSLLTEKVETAEMSIILMLKDESSP